MQSQATGSKGSKINPVVVIPNKLFWVSDKKPPKGEGKAFYFCVDDDLKYIPFLSDFGPLNLAQVYRFITELDKIMKNSDFKDSPLFQYTSDDSAKRSNAAFLMGCYQVISLKKTADEAWEPFQDVSPPFRAFRDASYLPCSYKCTVI